MELEHIVGKKLEVERTLNIMSAKNLSKKKKMKKIPY